MSNGITGLSAFQEGGPVLDKLKSLWEDIRGRADDPNLGYIGASMMPGVGEVTDLVEIGAGLQDRSLGRVGLGIAGLLLPFVGASALGKLGKINKKGHLINPRTLTKRDRIGGQQHRKSTGAGWPRNLFLREISQALQDPAGHLRRGRRMDPASREARAKKMGWDLDVYHGTELPFDPPNRFKVGGARGHSEIISGGRFGPGVYTTTSIKDAYNWIPSTEGRLHESTELPSSALSPRIYPLKVRSKNLIEYEGGEWADLAEELGFSRYPSREKWERNADITRLAREKGWEGVFNPPVSERKYSIGSRHPGEPLDYLDEINTGTEIMIFDPKNIRSRYAAFDPERRHSTDMMAGIAGLLGLGMAGKAGMGYSREGT